MIQLAHTSERNTGIQPPQTISAFNVYAEEQSILNANQALVQQIISSGLAAPGDTLAILGILLASGQVSSSLFSNGIALFGGGLTQSALSPGRGHGEPQPELLGLARTGRHSVASGRRRAGTVQVRHALSHSDLLVLEPVGQRSQYSRADRRGSLRQLCLRCSLIWPAALPNVPQVEYQDLGLTLKTTPKVMRNDDVALTIDMKIDALSGTSINGNPILNNPRLFRAWSRSSRAKAWWWSANWTNRRAAPSAACRASARFPA